MIPLADIFIGPFPLMHLIEGCAVPGVIAALIATAAGWKRQWNGAWAPPLAIAVGFIIGYWRFANRIAFPPWQSGANAGDWLCYIAAAIAILAIGDALVRPKWWISLAVVVLV